MEDLLLPAERYHLVQTLKRGAFGSVAVALDKKSSSLVALKFLERSQTALEFLEAEVLNQMRLSHPHVVGLHEVFLTEEHLVLAMDYAAGGDLAAHVPPGRGLPEPQARWLFQQLAFALDYCHRMGVASRDIKLENILIHQLDAHPIIKLADFGLSATRSQGASTQVVGTPAYMAPEVVAAGAGGPPYDPQKADVWSCGGVLYSLLTGSSPFQRVADGQLSGSGERMQAMLQRVQRADYPEPQGLSPECQDLLAALLNADPAARPCMAGILRHPWLREGICPEQMLRFNDGFIERTIAGAPCKELVAEVRDILYEACMGPPIPAPANPKAPQRANSTDAGAISQEGQTVPEAWPAVGGLWDPSLRLPSWACQ